MWSTATRPVGVRVLDASHAPSGSPRRAVLRIVLVPLRRSRRSAGCEPPCARRGTRRPTSARGRVELTLTITTPPFAAIARICSSVRLRGMFESARHEECDAKTGAFETSSTSAIVSSETCETSTSIPSRFISSTTSRPKSVRPSCTAYFFGSKSGREEVARGVGPVVRVGVRQRHVAHAQPVEGRRARRASPRWRGRPRCRSGSRSCRPSWPGGSRRPSR